MRGRVTENGRRRTAGFWIAFAFAASSAGCDRANEARVSYPRKPVKIIVPFSAGGGSDTFTRMMQNAIRENELLEQPVVILNVPGAGGTIGSRRVKNAQPDGYTLLNLHGGIITAKLAGQATYGPEAFQPIAATSQAAMVICVREDSALRALPSLLEKAKRKPDEVLFGTAYGTPSHFSGLRLEAASGAKFRYVQSGGGAKRFAALVGKHIDVSPFSMAEYLAFRDGGIRAISYLGNARHPNAADVPTAKEDGIAVTAFNIQYWWAPKGTPKDRVVRMADLFERAMQTDSVQSKLEAMSMEPLFLRGEELAGHLRERERELSSVRLVPLENLPRPMPVVLLATALLAVLVLWRFWRQREVVIQRTPHDTLAVVSLFAVIAAFVLALQFAEVSFAWVAVGFVVALGCLLGARSRRELTTLLVAGAVTGVGCLLVFTRLLVIDLP